MEPVLKLKRLKNKKVERPVVKINPKSKKAYYFEVAPKAPLFGSLTYKFFEPLCPGQRVKIPLGSRYVNGLILKENPSPLILKKLKNSSEKLRDSSCINLTKQNISGFDQKSRQKEKTSIEIKEISSIDKSFPPLSLQRIHWLRWMSSYYHYPLGLVADLSFPQTHFKELTNIKVGKSSEKQTNSSCHNKARSVFVQAKKTIRLTLEQEQCLNAILKAPGFNVHLIHGVTGSGKTEIYTQLIAHILDQKKQALVLLPEIFLTPQIVERFSKSFPNETALLHSQITAKLKKRTWQELISGQKNLLVGTRSALFCPLPGLGLIIIDEEHDSSFKQEGKFRYHARDSAIMLAKELNIPIILGSATPDFSSYKKALDGFYKFYELKKRALKQTLPKVSVVDLKNKPSKGQPFWLSDLLLEKITSTLNKGKQVALFLNRRGQATSLICSHCGYTQKCLNCDISLTLHRENYLLCHYCSYLAKAGSRCPSCQSRAWLEKGLGTQKIQDSLQKLFPQFNTLRVDRDSISSQEEMKQFIEKVEKNQVQIIIGTQMLAKGLNFPSIYLVGLILADMDFSLPDFRAEERTFQTLVQMAGRAGRTAFGEVILQSFNPDHPSILFAQKHDYKSFFYERMKSRQRLFYPPFSRLCLLRMDSFKEVAGRLFAQDIFQKAKKLADQQMDKILLQESENSTQGLSSKKDLREIQILGPSPAPLMKIKNRYRFQILIKGKNYFILDEFLKKLLPAIPKKAFVQVKVDRDPSSML